jgi:hypothetical protein
MYSFCLKKARLADVPRNTLLLLEDIDAAFASR